MKPATAADSDLPPGSGLAAEAAECCDKLVCRARGAITAMDKAARKRAIEEGIRLFNSGNFFEAHEALEGVWLESSGEEKTFLHGVIQVAAAFHHLQHSNLEGFRSLLEKGWKKVEPFGAACSGLDLASLDRQLQPWREFLDRRAGGEIKPPPLPEIRFIKES